MFLAIDVIEEVDGVFDDTLADITEVTAALLGCCCLVNHHRLAQFTVQVNLVVANFKEFLEVRGK